MSITLNEQKIIASTQTFVFDELHITGGKEGKLKATVSFLNKNEAGELVSVETLTYTGEAYNAFWTAFTSGKYLYDKLVEDKEINTTVPNSVEDNFLNAPDPVVEDQNVPNV